MAGIFGRGKEVETTPEAAPEPAPPAEKPAAKAPSPAPAAGGLTAFLDQGVDFEGKVVFRDRLRVDGRVRGEIESEGTLMIGEQGDVEAGILGTTVVICGRVMGDITASRQVVIHKTGAVVGDLVTPSLVMEEGGFHNGQVTMKSPAPPAKGDGKQGGAGHRNAHQRAQEAEAIRQQRKDK